MSRRRRRPGGAEKAQKGKSKKRGAGWHKGYAQGVVNEHKIQRALPAFERAEQNRLEVEAQAHEHARQVREWEGLLAAVSRASPAILSRIHLLGVVEPSEPDNQARAASL